MERIEELLECPVCLDRFKEPRVLPCQHTFCLRPCLQNIVENNSVRCPECRASHNLRQNGVDGLPPNLTIVRLLDRSDQQKPNRQCKGCELGDGDLNKCNHCDESLCRSCIASHTRNLQQDLNHSLVQVRQLVPKLAELDSDLRERAKRLEENGRNVKHEISQSIERYISELESRKKCLLEEVDALIAMETGSLQCDQEDLEAKMAALMTHCQVGNEICERELTLEGGLRLSGYEMQQFQSEIIWLAQQCHGHIQSKEIPSDKVRQAIKFLNGDDDVVFSAICNFGAVSAYPQHALGGEPTPRDVTRGANDVPRISERQQTCGASAGPHAPREPSARVAPAPPVAQTDSGSRITEALQRYRDKGPFKKCFGKKGNDARWKIYRTNLVRLDHPIGISSTSADDIVVADTYNHRIQIFDVNGQVKGIIGNDGTLEGQFKLVKDVCVMSRERIVASDHGVGFVKHRIQIFDEQGKFVRKFGGEGSGDGKLNYPWGVATDDNGLIYVCDANNHRVQVFSDGGKFVRKFGSESLKYPHYLSVASNGRVVVSDVGNQRVHVFDSYGRHLFQFGAEGTSDSQFNCPQGIATDDHGNIIVAEQSNHRVHVFTSDGEFVNRFGSAGSDPGQMNQPVGVCLLSDGGIAVSDSGNHRVQIF